MFIGFYKKKILFIEIGFQSQKDASSKFRSKHLFFLGGVDAGASQKRGEMDHPQRERPAAGDQAQQRHECDERI